MKGLELGLLHDFFFRSLVVYQPRKLWLALEVHVPVLFFFSAYISLCTVSTVAKLTEKNLELLEVVLFGQKKKKKSLNIQYSLSDLIM
jgi:hypothetical protein